MTPDSARRLVAGNALFFPAATIYALLILPASVLAMTGHLAALPGLASPTGHAHEMLFGFALAVVAGNQLGPSAVPRLAALFTLWALARTTFLVAPQSSAATAANVAFAALLAAQLAPRLLGTAKKLRNQALPLVLIAICAASAAFHLVARTSLAVAVLLFALLMLFMGGRLIAPAVAGQFYRQGAKLDARVQPRIEAGLIAGMAIAATTVAFNEQGWIVSLAAAATATSGLLAAARLLRWRLWGLRSRPDLLCLAAGYGWLALGLLLYGAALAADRDKTAALHVITVGGLGTLTLNVMAMTTLLKARRDPARARLPLWGTLLIGAATLARALAGVGIFHPQALLNLAGLLWSTAFALLLAQLIRTARASSRLRGNPAP